MNQNSFMMNELKIHISRGIAKLLKKKNVKHFQLRRDFTFDDSSRQDYMDHFQQSDMAESQELKSRDQ